MSPAKFFDFVGPDFGRFYFFDSIVDNIYFLCYIVYMVINKKEIKMTDQEKYLDNIDESTSTIKFQNRVRILGLVAFGYLVLMGLANNNKTLHEINKNLAKIQKELESRGSLSNDTIAYEKAAALYDMVPRVKPVCKQVKEK